MISYTPVNAPDGVVPAGLTETSSTHEIVRYLLEVAQMSRRDIAETIGTTEMTVGRWARDPDAKPREGAITERLDALRDLAWLLSDTLPGENTGRWIRNRTGLLDGDRPKDFIASDYRRVRDAAEKYISGDPM